MILMIKRYADGSDNICMVKRGFIYLCAFESFCYWKYIVRILVICIDAKKKGVFTHTPNTPSFIYRLRGVMKCCMLWWQKSYIRFDILWGMVGPGVQFDDEKVGVWRDEKRREKGVV